VNFFLRPYPLDMTEMDIIVDKDDDVIIAAYLINWMLLLTVVAMLVYSLRNRKLVDYVLYILCAVIVGFVIYWHSFL
jgi:TctA family transporter